MFFEGNVKASANRQVLSDIRDSSRIISCDPVFAQQIFERISPYLPCVWQGRRLLGLNEHLKILRYGAGQKFKAHFDGCFRRPGTANQTFLTVQLYLSAGKLSGGATRFVGAADDGVDCLPTKGKAVIFQHNILHEGAEVFDGIKYTIRTETKNV